MLRRNGSLVIALKVLAPCISAALAVAFARSARANVAVEPPFASSMVLQREMPVPVWGTAAAGEQVTVSIDAQTKTVATPGGGKWSLELDPMPAGGPYVMTIKGTNTVTFDDVYIGEVWQAAGQSNMDTRLNFYSGLTGEIAKASHPLLRYYTLRQPGQTTSWEVVSPSTAGPLSALAYFFGKEIQEKTGVAVGLVVTAVGGTTIASWLDPATLSAHTEIKDGDRGSMWNSWVAPAVGYGLRGTIWFQGEQNTNGTDAPSYGERFNWLIRGWRTAWGQGDFPFLFGQLSNIHDAQTDPNNTSNVATVREGQRLALALPGTAMSVNMDIGVAGDWHFPNKPEAGHRLALAARAKVYGEPGLTYSGPLYASKAIVGDKVTLSFDQVGAGLSRAAGVHSRASPSRGRPATGYGETQPSAAIRWSRVARACHRPHAFGTPGATIRFSVSTTRMAFQRRHSRPRARTSSCLGAPAVLLAVARSTAPE